MDCRAMMAPIKTKLFADEPAGKIIDFMLDKHMGLVPVTERDGTFVGLISGDGLMHRMLPKSISVMSRVKRGMKHASYMDESVEEMQERLEALRERTIGELVNGDAKTVNPDTPLIDALMLITGKQYVVPVVDQENRLVGAISFFSVLYELQEEYDRDTVQKGRQEDREERRREKASRRQEQEE